MRRIAPYFPPSHGVTRVDYRRVISGIIFVIKSRLRLRGALPGYGSLYRVYRRRNGLASQNAIAFMTYAGL